MFCAPTKGLWSFGDLDTATWSEAEAVEGLSYSTRLEQRRSYRQLRTGQCSRPEGTSTLLLVRTLRRTPVAPSGQGFGP